MIIKSNWADQKQIPSDLILAKELVYDFCNFEVTVPQAEAESKEYDACDFQINQKHIKFRSAKITPTKNGQFVTLWKRNKSGIIEPFDFSDTIDFVIVNVRKEALLGQFIFPKEVLLAKGIFSTPKKEGIRATRVYPPWDETTSKQAQKTQQWQLNYFYEINKSTNFNTIQNLFCI
ncbi:MepB family protein [Flavobacterium sp. MC2016-06]|uniref:MepB family protein n=1 Tax=Flavobacterium sp. MC2016-06 TaxID=2676308 RepID=UPI0012BABCED|nr:MepB family protein [Flavobacterium sp. MC2016-06]MBU3861600.1 MepB family protein [Flavobacterium sp. MC2016-06]